MRQLEPQRVLTDLGMPQLSALGSFSSLSEPVVRDLLLGGTVDELKRGEYIARFDEEAADFQILLRGKLAYYKRCEDHDVLTRTFEQGEQLGFDEMIGLFKRNGTDVALEDSLILNISNQQFYQLHKQYPGEFGIFMLNLALELSHEIAALEDVVARGTGWVTPG